MLLQLLTKRSHVALRQISRGYAEAVNAAPVPEILAANGVPPVVGRKVTIYAPARTAAQQGLAQTPEGTFGLAWFIAAGVRVP
jgi:hypothetical protein